MKKLFLPLTIIILSFLLICSFSVSAQSDEACKNFQQGYFKVETEPLGTFYIEQRNNKHIAHLQGSDITCNWTVEWEDNCRYLLTLDSCENGQLYFDEQNKHVRASILKAYGDTFKVKSEHFNPRKKTFVKISEKEFNEGKNKSVGTRREKQIQNFLTVKEGKATANKIIQQLEGRKYEEVYDGSHSKLKDKQTLEDFQKYMRFTEDLYGKVGSTEVLRANAREVPSYGKVVQLSYKAFMEKYEGKLSVTLMEGDKGSLKLAGLNITTSDSVKVAKIEKITSAFFKKCRKGNYKKIYQDASERFKEYTTIPDFDEFAETMKRYGEIESKQQSKHQIAIKDNRLVVVTLYQLEFSEAQEPKTLKLIYAEQENGNFLMAGADLK